MPRFIFESGCEKLAPAMVKGRLPAHVSAVLALLLLAAAGASAQTAPPTLGVLVNQVLALFPKVNGKVLEVQGTTLTLSLGQRDGLVAGVELTAYREGRELRHPKTGEILGRTEEVLGRVAVHQVQEAYATGAVVGGSDIRPGDKVRVSAGKIQLTLLPLGEGVKGDLSAAGKPRESQTPAPTRSLLSRLLTGELDAGTYSSGETSMPLKEAAKFPFAVVAMDVAVAPQDQIPRMVVTDGERIYLYKIVERVLEPEWTYQPDARGRVFSAQFADLNNTGVLDGVVNRYHPNPRLLLNSFVLTTQGGKPAVLVEEVPDVLLAVDATGDGSQ